MTREHVEDARRSIQRALEEHDGATALDGVTADLLQAVRMLDRVRRRLTAEAQEAA